MKTLHKNVTKILFTAVCFHKMLLALKNEKKATTKGLIDLVDKENIIKFARPFHMTILAQNAQGLKNLFKIVSLANTKYLLKGKEPKIPRTRKAPKCPIAFLTQ